jgi:hypothetical protein
MAAPFFTFTDGTFTFVDGDIKKITSRIVGSPDLDSIPGTPPSYAMLFDTNGATKTITLSGELSSNGLTRVNTSSVITINEQRQYLEKQLTGFQPGAGFEANYCSTWTGSSWIASRVVLAEITWDEETGNPLNLPFTIVLYVGDT